MAAVCEARKNKLMTRATVRLTLPALLALASPVVFSAVPASAQQASAEVTHRANQLPALLRGDIQPTEPFTEAFLAQAPPAQLTSLFARLRTEHGAVRGVSRVEPRSATAATVFLDFERATLRINLMVEAQAPHRISGLLIRGVEVRGDSLQSVAGEFRSLPGRGSFAVARLGEGGPTYLAAHDAQRTMAIGSAFKLFVLAELSRQIQAGERRWADVVRLDRRSLPSGQMQSWPDGSPVTLHTLAALMISISDNTATDMLLHVVGRENVERRIPAIGVTAGARNRPLLSTREAFALKRGGPELLARWTAADERARRAILASLAAAPLGTRAGSGPIGIEEAEWFASAEDLVRTVDWLRRNGDDQTRAIMAINPGLSPDLAEEFSYLGYKGGSEPGVINMTFLARSRSGVWHAITGSWNNSAAAVDNDRFVRIMDRAVRLIRE